MNHEILFRGKRVDNGEWVEGSLLSYKGKNHIYHVDDMMRGTLAVYPLTVSQYIGLTDKNGTRIFEGDIVSAHGYKGYIAMDTDYWEIHWNNNFERSLYVWGNTIEVIGNVYDNPELLKGEEK